MNECQLPSFLSRLSLQKIYLIGNAVRLLRYMLREESDAKYATELFTHSPIIEAVKVSLLLLPLCLLLTRQSNF